MIRKLLLSVAALLLFALTFSRARAQSQPAVSTQASIVVPQPIPSNPSPPLVAAAAVGWRSNAPTPGEIKRVRPTVEVWRAGSSLPQRPNGRAEGNTASQRLSQALLAGNESIFIRLRFDPSATGKAVIVRAALGISLQPAEQQLVIQPNGEVAVTVTLDPAVSQSHLTFYCEGITTRIPIARARAQIVTDKENREGRGQ